MAQGQVECERLMRIADAALAATPFLSGRHLGIGDIPLGCIAYAWFSLPIERPELTCLLEWYECLMQRPAYRKAVMTGLS